MWFSLPQHSGAVRPVEVKLPPYSVHLTRRPGKALLFDVRVSNDGCGALAVCKYDFAWQLDLYDRELRLSDEEAYRRGGAAPDGTIHYPPGLLVQMPIDWVVLRRGESIVFSKGVFVLGRALTEIGTATRATVRLLPKELEPPDWIVAYKIPILDQPAVGRWTVARGEIAR